MSLVTKLVQCMKAFDRKAWPAHRVALSPELAAILRQQRMVVADVGSAGGPEETWLNFKEFIHFVTFEPNPRPGEAGSDEQTTNFPIGLWSAPGKGKLYLTAHPDSSSLLPINIALFADFLTKEGMEMVGSTTIELETLDRLLAGKPKLRPDFIKVDVEGGELEVLKGANEALAQSVLGLRVETSFLEQQIGRPLLGEVDEFLRERGFVLFHLGRNHWIRNNGQHGYTSAPQITMGDAVYFLSREKFIQRLTACPAAERQGLVLRFVVLLAIRGVHDYAWDIVDAAQRASLVPGDFAASVKLAIAKSVDSSLWYFFKSALGVGFAFLVLLVSLPMAEPRKRGKYYVKQRVGRFGYDLFRRAGLEGRAPNSYIGDQFV